MMVWARSQPGGRVGRRPAVGDLEVEPGQLPGGELGADGVEQPHQRRAVGVDDLAADHRDHVVGRLELPVVCQLDQVGSGLVRLGSVVSIMPTSISPVSRASAVTSRVTIGSKRAKWSW